MNQTHRTQQFKGKDINLQLYISTKNENFTTSALTHISKGIQENEIKRTYDADLEEQIVRDLLINEKLNITTNSLEPIPRKTVTKKRSGRNKSPPPRKNGKTKEQQTSSTQWTK